MLWAALHKFVNEFSTSRHYIFGVSLTWLPTLTTRFLCYVPLKKSYQDNLCMYIVGTIMSSGKYRLLFSLRRLHFAKCIYRDSLFEFCFFNIYVHQTWLRNNSRNAAEKLRMIMYMKLFQCRRYGGNRGSGS